MTEAAGPETAQGGNSRLRSVLAGISLVLASLTIVVAVTAVWVHQVALKTERFTEIVTEVVDDPALAAPVATKVSEQVVTGLALEQRIAEQLPERAARLAGPMTTVVQDAITRRLEQALSNPRVQAGLVRALEVSHERIVAFLRGETSALTVQDGYLYLDVFPIVGAALSELQSMGLIPADVVLPDLSSDAAPAAISDRLETALGVTLSPTFGTIQLMPAERLETAQTVVRAFDILVVGVILLAVALSILAIAFARNRRRMFVFVALGAVVGLALAQFVIRGVATAALDGIADKGVAAGLTAVVDVTVQDLIQVMTLILIAAGVLAVIGYLAGRPAWLTRGASRSTAASKDGLERIGVALIAFALAWIVLGLQVALLGAALVGGWLLLVSVISGGSEQTDDGGGSATGPTRT